QARGTMPLATAYLCVIAAHACAGAWPLFRWQLSAAIADQVDEGTIVEALLFMAFLGSVPNFARACGAWQAMILAGEVSASEAFRTWAELSGQGGYDEATGVSRKPSA
ncbi:MAG: hypothetical protein AAGH19_10630, partial [Pseudomonadota bacterium]